MNKTQSEMARQKEALLIILKKVPIIQAACAKVGIDRSTYYRWRQDPEFAKAADAAHKDGIQVVNDVAESKLLGKIEEGNMTGIIFWLKNHHKAYEEKVTVKAQRAEEVPIVLTPEEQAIAKRCLQVAAHDEAAN